ncbi:MAG: histidine phosphatase family protein [Aestuariivita sp.]|nr:histidine phosphatase family protein [Aestuariivita sp.]MCY4345485.1 histidine phosphatase family protein [Aestuariivita sp.]
MPLRLILMRHAKSSWGNANLSDFDRPLNTRGYESAAALGIWLRQEILSPKVALVSPSLRTIQTFEGLQLSIEPKLIAGLYHASSFQMMHILSTATAQSVLMIGHNPGIADFASSLVNRPVSHDRFRAYPTGATLVVDFDREKWSDITPNSGEVFSFVTPRSLTS